MPRKYTRKQSNPTQYASGGRRVLQARAHWKKRAMMSGANAAVKAGLSGLGSYVANSVAGSKRAAPYRTSQAFKRQRMSMGLRKRMARRSQGGLAAVSGLRVGRSRRPTITSKDMLDMLAPTMHINEQRSFENSWTRGKQGLWEEAHMTVAEMDQWITKMQDSSSVNPIAGANILGNTFANYTFWHNGYTVKYTIQNSCTNDIILDMLEMSPRRPTSLTVGNCWRDDLFADDSILNAQAPVQGADRVPEDIDCRPGSTGLKFNAYYRKKYLGRKHLRPGEEFVFEYRVPGFSYNVGKYNQHVDTTNVAGSDRAVYFEKTKFLYFIGKSQLIQDSADADTTFGSGKISVAMQKKGSYRCVPSYKRDQHVFISTLPTTFTTEQHLNEESGILGSYAGI